MKIIYVLPGLFVAGGVRVALEHVRRLAARGYDAEVWCPRTKGEWGRLPVYADQSRVRLFDDYQNLARELPGTRGIKVATAYGTGFLVANCLRTGDTGYSLVQDIETSYAPDATTAATVLASYQNGLTPITEGRWVDARLRERYGLAPRYVGIGLDHEHFFPDRAVAAERSILAQARVIGGGPNRLKDWPTTEAVLRRVAPAGGEVSAITFSPEAPVTLADAQHRHAGMPTDRELADLYRRAGVFVFASKHEGFGLPAAEAMACGCPVVATRANGNEEFCIDGETALLTSPGDVDGLADRVQQLLNDPRLAGRIADAGRAKVQEYRWEPVIDRLIDALELPSTQAVSVPAEVPLAVPAETRTRGVVLLASELGYGFGHIRPLLTLASALDEAGFDPVLAVPNLVEAWPLTASLPYPVVQAPRCSPRQQVTPPPGFLAGFTDILATHGYAAVDELLPLLNGWDRLLEWLEPVLVVADYAPTATLAAVGVAPTVTIGGGFEVPPTDQPAFPVLLHDGHRVVSDANVLSVVQETQRRRKRPIPETLPGAFPGARFVTVIPALDPYATHRLGGLVGPLEPLPPRLPPATRGGYFAYWNSSPGTHRLAVELGKTGWVGEIYLRGASRETRTELRAAGVPVIEHPRPWVDVLTERAVILHHGGIGTTQTTAAAGRPQILFPEHLEQLLTAHLLDNRKAGVKLVSPTVPTALEAVRRVLTERCWTEQAQAFADEIAQWNTTDLEQVLGYCVRAARTTA